METKTSHVPAAIYDYVLAHGVREPDLLKQLRTETARMPEAIMQISPDQGAFMSLLVKLMGARRILEVGVFTGYSSLSMALALPSDGRLTALDISAEWTSIARRYWREAGVDNRVDLIVGPALATLQSLEDSQAGGYDIAFIDADKQNYPQYYEHALSLLRPGGLIVIDNALHGGRVVDSDMENPDTIAIDRLNRHIRGDDRVDVAMIPVGDGLMLCRKREE